MACTIERNEAGVVSVLAANGNKSRLFQSLQKLPFVESEDDALVYHEAAQKYVGKDYVTDSNGEPIPFFASLSSRNKLALAERTVYTSSYEEALENDTENKGIEVGFIKKKDVLDLGLIENPSQLFKQVRDTSIGSEGQVMAMANNGTIIIADSSTNNFKPITKVNNTANDNSLSSFINNLVQANLVQPTKVPMTEIQEEGSTIDFDLLDMGEGNLTVMAHVNGSKVGHLRLNTVDNNLQVESVLVDKEFRNLGIAKELYFTAIQATGQEIYSDTFQLPEATALWESLVRDGYAEKLTKTNKLTGEQQYLYKVNKDIFNLGNEQAQAAAIIMDRLIGTMAARENISKEDMYNKVQFEKTYYENLPEGAKMQAAEYYERNADRLPLTLQVFERPEFKNLQGKFVNPITVLNSLNQSGIKQVEKDLIKNVIEENYQGQKKISYDELEATVRANIMPLERIFTSSYADYGMNNLGNGDYGDANTIILNSQIEHGVTGHFSGAFKASGRKNIKYVPKQLNDNTWVAVEEGYQAQANNNNIYQFVGTAGTKEAVDNWIEEYEVDYRGTVEEGDIVNYTIDGEEFEGKVEDVNGEVIQVTNGITGNLDIISHKYLKDFVSKPNRDINKGMFGHIRVWQDNTNFYVAELQSDYFQKYNAKKSLIEDSKDYMDGIRIIQSTINEIEESKYTLEKLEKDREERGIKYYESLGLPSEVIKEISEKSASNIEYYKNFINKNKNYNEYKEIEKLKERLSINLSPQEKQFIASQKEWEKRLLREALKEASLSGATNFRLPTPYTLSVIEGYVSEEGGLPYYLNRSDFSSDVEELEAGDTIEYIGESYTILEANSESITVAPSSQTYSVNIKDFLNEEIDYRTEETINNELGFDINGTYTQEEWNDINSKHSLFEYVEFSDIADEIEDDVFKIDANKVEDVVREFYKGEYSDVVSVLTDMGYDNIYVSGNTAYHTEWRVNTEILGQPSTYESTSDKNDFSIEDDLSSEQQTVARKYEELAKILEQERGAENVEVITDDNGFDWYETKLDPSEVNKPVVAFQKEGKKAQGAVMVAQDGSAIIYALTDPNVTTPLHEMAHVFEHYLTSEEKDVVVKNAGTKGWTMATSEYFARGFEKYLSEGKSPVKELQYLFDKFKRWLTDIYNGITNSSIDIILNDEMRSIYDKMLLNTKKEPNYKLTSFPQAPTNGKPVEQMLTEMIMSGEVEAHCKF